ncbi:MAG: hypothetical protein PF689_02120 [Deltaproteobacteria bacterium]|jgi:hypothetical protein|nr:hypothetical protein [Deltaproteobacteria bacterium]
MNKTPSKLIVCLILVVALPAAAQNKKKKTEDRKISKAIKNLRDDYKFFKQGVLNFNNTTEYLVKRSRRNERIFLEEKLEAKTEKAKVKDIIERAKLLKLLEEKLKKYSKSKDPLWVPEILWRTGVLYHEIAEELNLWVFNEDEETGKVKKFDPEYEKILQKAYKLGKGAIRPADTTLGVNHYRKKAADNLKRLVTEFPQFRAIGSVYHLLARLYEKPPLSIQDIDNKMPAKVSLGAVCSNWQYQPFQNDFKEFLKNKGQGLLTAESDKNYKNWMIYDFPTNLPFDLFKNCQAVNGSVQFIGTAWATLGKFLSKKTIEFKPVNPDATEEEQIKVKLFNLAMTKWAALSAYNRALSSDFKELSTRGYVVYFAGLMLYQNEINPALAMKLFDQVIDMGQNQDENSPHEAAIKYIGFLMQEEKIDSSKYNWTKPYPVKCDGKCPLKKLRVYYKDKMHKPHVKRIWLGVADFFRGLEDNKIYQRSEQDLIHAYNIYSYIFRKMDVEGGWKYNPRKADIFWKMREIITEQMQNYRSLLKEVKSRRDIKEIRNKISFWSNKKNALSQYALNTVFAPGEIQKFLTSHQKFLSRNAIKKMKLRTVSLDKLRKDIVNIKSYALISSGEILADQAKDLFFQYQKAKGSRKEELRKQAKSAFEKAYKYFLGIMEEYPNSIYEYNSMIRILEFYCELPGSSDDSISKD